jgi:hypothetical protein
MSDEIAEAAFFIMLVLAFDVVAFVAAGAFSAAHPVIVMLGELR